MSDDTVSDEYILRLLKRSLHEISTVLLRTRNLLVPNSLEECVEKLNRNPKNQVIPQDCVLLLTVTHRLIDRNSMALIAQTLDCFISMVGCKYGSLVKDDRAIRVMAGVV